MVLGKLGKFQILTFVGFIFAGGCISTEYNVATHREDIFFYSTDREVSLGRNLSHQVEKEFKISHNPFYLERVNKVGKKLREVCDRKEINYYFSVIESEEMNAFSLPGGYVYIFKGLLDNLENDSQLAFVIAHEIGHIVARHSIKKLQAALGYNLIVLATLPAKKSPHFYKGLSLALAQIISGYSQKDEFCADELAVKYLRLAGFSPAESIKVLEKIYLYEKKRPARPYPYFRTHPSVWQRIHHIKEVLGIPLEISDYLNK